MENYGEYIGDEYAIRGNTRWASDVIYQYYSWEEYALMSPPSPKVKLFKFSSFFFEMNHTGRVDVCLD